jgi:hypothetical protein
LYSKKEAGKLIYNISIDVGNTAAPGIIIDNLNITHDIIIPNSPGTVFTSKAIKCLTNGAFMLFYLKGIIIFQIIPRARKILVFY